MKMTMMCMLAVLSALLVGGCQTPPVDSRITVQEVPSIQIRQVSTRRTPEGFMEVQATGYNASREVNRFQYRVEWLDAQGFVYPTKTTVWQAVSARPRSVFTIRSVAPHVDAVDYRINTRPQP